VARMISAWGCRVVPESYDQACTTEAPGGGAVGPVGDGALAPEEEGDAHAFSRGGDGGAAETDDGRAQPGPCLGAGHHRHLCAVDEGRGAGCRRRRRWLPGCRDQYTGGQRHLAHGPWHEVK
jgi:hypothetical protein